MSGRIVYVFLMFWMLIGLACNFTGTSESATETPPAVLSNEPVFPACSVYPNGDTPVNIYLIADENAEVQGTLEPGSSLPAELTERDWYILGGENTPFFHHLIKADQVTLAQPCQCTPGCVAQAAVPTQAYTGPTSTCQVRPMYPVAVYAGPDVNTTQQATIGNDLTTYVFTQRDNFYQVYVPALNDYGWVARGTLEQLTECSDIPVESLPDRTTCIAVNTAGDAIGVYAQPNTDSSMFLRMSAGNSFQVIGSQAGWYRVGFNAAENGADGEGWVEAESIALEGPCESYE